MPSKLKMSIWAQKGELCQPTIVAEYVVLDGVKVEVGGVGGKMEDDGRSGSWRHFALW